jgi:anaerobic ribonucleoside-triphosphate reductase activating protein
MEIAINYILPVSRANGPGKRFTIWVQGCSIRCPGCSNVKTWDPDKGQKYTVEDLIKQINNSTVKLDGVTITGGEPLDQFDAVYDLCSKLFGSISVFLTTGYTLKQMIEKNFLKILEVLDIICIGPFEKDKVSQNKWKGSENQDIVCLTRLGEKQSCMPVISKEIHIGKNGDSVITGFTL